MTYIPCPRCDHDEIHEHQDGSLACQHCGHRFTASPQPPEQVLTELRQQTALLRKLATLLERHLRHGVTEEDKDRIVQQLQHQRGLTTGDVTNLIQCSKNAALAIMKDIGAAEGYRYIHGSGNQPSRLVRLARHRTNTTP